MSKRKSVYFLWDYDLIEKDVKKIVHGKNETEKVWIISRILESAKYDDIWRYLSLNEVRKIYPQLKLKKPIKQAWDYALKVWEDD